METSQNFHKKFFQKLLDFFDFVCYTINVLRRRKVKEEKENMDSKKKLKVVWDYIEKLFHRFSVITTKKERNYTYGKNW